LVLLLLLRKGMQAACTHGRSGRGVNGGGGLRKTTSGAVQGRQLTKVGGLSVQRGQRLIVAVVIARRLLLRRTLLLLLLLVLLLSLLLLDLLLLSLLLLMLRMLRVLLLSLLLLLLVMGRVAREGRKVCGLRHVGGGGVLVLHIEAVNDVVVGGK
jgi:hypothetical protein